MRIQVDRAAVVINRCVFDLYLGHGGAGLLDGVQINTQPVCASLKSSASNHAPGILFPLPGKGSTHECECDPSVTNGRDAIQIPLNTHLDLVSFGRRHFGNQVS